MSLQAQPRKQNKSAHPREYALSILVNELAPASSSFACEGIPAYPAQM